jgi:hypothetical protein
MGDSGRVPVISAGVSIVLANVAFVELIATWQSVLNVYLVIQPHWRELFLVYFPASLIFGPAVTWYELRRRIRWDRALRRGSLVALTFNTLFLPLGASGM